MLANEYFDLNMDDVLVTSMDSVIVSATVPLVISQRKLWQKVAGTGLVWGAYLFLVNRVRQNK